MSTFTEITRTGFGKRNKNAILVVTVALIVPAVKKIRKTDQPPPLNA